MTQCNRCGSDFENHFNGVYWCTHCGKQFSMDENLFNKEPKNELQ